MRGGCTFCCVTFVADGAVPFFLLFIRRGRRGGIASSDYLFPKPRDQAKRAKVWGGWLAVGRVPSLAGGGFKAATFILRWLAVVSPSGLLLPKPEYRMERMLKIFPMWRLWRVEDLKARSFFCIEVEEGVRDGAPSADYLFPKPEDKAERGGLLCMAFWGVEELQSNVFFWVGEGRGGGNVSVGCLFPKPEDKGKRGCGGLVV